MEEKLLELLKLANTLDEKQDKFYAKIDYCANGTRQLEISIIDKKNYTYVERCSIMLLNNPISKLDAIIKVFEEYIKSNS